MVILSLVEVGGFMHYWGLTIDTVSCVNLIIAIGLCVDYSAHIAHGFLVEQVRSILASFPKSYTVFKTKICSVYS
jgi:predicted RND superfamily exporter protein